MEASLYSWIKYLHIGCAVLAIAGFTARGILLFTYPTRLKQRWIRIAPHINDSVLLACAIYLAIKLGQYPGTTDWLTAKVLGLILYILLGMTTLKWAPTRHLQLLAFLGALLSFGYIVAVAVTRSVIPGI